MPAHCKWGAGVIGSGTMIKRVAFLGSGTMGAGTTRKLLEAGFDLTVRNRTRAKAEALLAAGARWADSPRQAGP